MEKDAWDSEGEVSLPYWVKRMDTSFVHFVLTIPLAIWAGAITIAMATNDGQPVVYRMSYLMFFIAVFAVCLIHFVTALLRWIVERKAGCDGTGMFSYFYAVAKKQESSTLRLALHMIGYLNIGAGIAIGISFTGGLPLMFYIMTQLQR